MPVSRRRCRCRHHCTISLENRRRRDRARLDRLASLMPRLLAAAAEHARSFQELQRSREMTRVYSAEVDQTVTSDHRADFDLDGRDRVACGEPAVCQRAAHGGTSRTGEARRRAARAQRASWTEPSTSPIWCSATSAADGGVATGSVGPVCCDGRLASKNAPAAQATRAVTGGRRSGGAGATTVAIAERWPVNLHGVALVAQPAE